MEQAHTWLIAQLNERILAADNTPLYKVAETVKKMPCAAVLEHGNILPGERDLNQLTGVSRITVRKGDTVAGKERRGDAFARGYGTQINAYLRILVERSARFFLSRWYCAGKARYAMG